MLASQLACGRPPGGTPEPSRTPAVPEARLASADAVIAGEALFLRHCASCHGERGDGKGPRAARLAHAPADLTTLPPDRTTPRRLFEVLHQGVPGSDMPSWQALEERERWDLVAYLRTLAGARMEETR
jgi:mono/diheme cytochrome c family protein